MQYNILANYENEKNQRSSALDVKMLPFFRREFVFR
jgi:hypothetical protein